VQAGPVALAAAPWAELAATRPVAPVGALDPVALTGPESK